QPAGHRPRVDAPACSVSWPDPILPPGLQYERTRHDPAARLGHQLSNQSYPENGATSAPSGLQTVLRRTADPDKGGYLDGVCPDKLSSGRTVVVALFYAKQKFLPCGSGVGNVEAVRLRGIADED